MQFLGDSHQSFSKSIALWIVWAAGDVVNLIETQEVVELPGTVARSVVRSQNEQSAKFSEDKSQFLDHCMCVELLGSLLTIRYLEK